MKRIQYLKPTYYDTLLSDAAHIIVETQIAKIADIQRQFDLCINRATKVMDELEMVGIVSALDNTTYQRQVLVKTEDELVQVLKNIGMTTFNYIFLDFDGVLNTGDCQRELSKWDLPCEDKYGRLFSPQAMNNLYRIVEATDAMIVVISSWKSIHGLDGLRQMWKKRGYKGMIHAVTRNDVSDEWLLNADLSALEDFSMPHPKGMEIADYLKTHEVTNYVIIDDEPIALDEQKEHLFMTNPNVGLTDDVAESVIEYLK